MNGFNTPYDTNQLLQVLQDIQTKGHYPTPLRIAQDPNVSIVNIIGFNTAISTTFAELNFTNSLFDPSLTNGKINVVSTSNSDTTTAGTGIQSLLLSGLDTGYNQITETVALNGTTGAMTTNDFHRLNSVLALSIGTNKSAVGTINFNAVSSANIHAVMRAGDSTCYIGRYTTPSGYSLYSNGVSTTCGSADEITLKLQLKLTGLPLQDSGLVVITYANSNNITNNFHQRVPEKTDIIILAQKTTGSNGKSTAIFTGYLISDTIDLI
jgi:hypothetical protein